MKTVHLREAKATFSAVVDAALKGEPTIVTKHGKAAAMIVPVDDGRRLYPEDRPSFADVLMDFPGPLDVERDQTPPREIDL